MQWIKPFHLEVVLDKGFHEFNLSFLGKCILPVYQSTSFMTSKNFAIRIVIGRGKLGKVRVKWKGRNVKILE